MKSFTKFYVLALTLLVSSFMMGQKMTDLEWQVMQQKAQEEQALHGPTVDVPFEPNATRATGDDCSDPIVLTVSPGMNPVTDLGQTTCGRVDDYANSCMGLYDGGEDIIYELVVTGDMELKFLYDPVDSWSGFAIKDQCGDAGTCLLLNTGSGSTARELNWSATAGTYYIMIDTWPNPTCTGFDLIIEEFIPPPPADPITSFPYFEDFETGFFPNTMQPFSGGEADASVTAAAAFESSYGALLEGNSFSGFVNNTNCNGAFTSNYPLHVAQVKMNYTPDGTPGNLRLEFDFYQSYSFVDYYSGFRVTIDGTPIVESTTGQDCIKGDVDWTHLEYDLSAYQTAGQNYELILDFYGKYELDYFNGGDAAFIDNVYLWLQPAGDVEGVAYDGDASSPLPGVEVGFLGDNPPMPPVLTNASGFYRFSNVATEPTDEYTMYAFLDGQNYVEQGVIVVPFNTVTLNFNMASPLMVITPAVLEETMNPGEYRSVPITITNGPTGGPLSWTAEIQFGPPPSGAPEGWPNLGPAPQGSVPADLYESSAGPAPLEPVSVAEGDTRDPMFDGLRAPIVYGVKNNAPTSYAFFDAEAPGTVTDISAWAGSGFSNASEIKFDDHDYMYELDNTGGIREINLTDGSVTQLGNVGVLANAMALDYTDGTYYATDGNNLYTIDFENATSATVGSLGAASGLLMIGMTFDTDGNLYMYELVTDNMWSCDKTTGACTQIGSIGFNANFGQGMAWDDLNGQAVLSAFNSGSFAAEYRVADLTTGNTSFLGNIGTPGQTQFGTICIPVAAGGGGWLDLSAFSGNVLAGESDFVNALFNATDTEPGQVWTADVVFTAEPNISTAIVDVSMIIAGETLIPVEDFEAELIDPATGQVDMTWSMPNREITFEYYLIRRNGSPIANTQNTSYTDFMPEYGEFCYTVSAVYAEGESVPAGPECIIWLIPELCYTPDTLYGEVWEGDEEVFQLTMENCGEGVLSYEFTGFDDPDFSNGFVTSVSPFSGQIPEGESVVVNVTFDATGFPPGPPHVTNLELMTNEQDPNDEREIRCEMLVYTPATLFGSAEDCDDSAPLPNVTVTAVETTSGMTFTGETDNLGEYEFFVDEGTYDITFSRLDYKDFLNPGVFAPAGVDTEANGVLCERPYAVMDVNLDPNEADTQALITWTLPMGPYEIIYDDGSAENYFAWAQFAGATAVRFTPVGYPATVAGGRIFVGDGTFPEGASFIGSPMSIGILDDDGPNGLPGTVLDSVTITCNNFGWVEFSFGGTTFNDGDFYLAYWQISVPPFSPPVGVDEENPVVFRSYQKQFGGEWGTSVYNDFMIRAAVIGPGENVLAAMSDGPQVFADKNSINGAYISLDRPKRGTGIQKGIQDLRPAEYVSAGERDLTNYTVARFNYPDPDSDLTPRDTTVVTTVSTTSYTDSGWGGLDPGFYGYAVQANYESDTAVWVFSNIAAHDLDNVVTVNVEQCDEEEPSGATVILEGFNFPYQMLLGVTPESGTVVFDSVINGRYDLTVSKLGYQTFEFPGYNLTSDWTIDVTLQETAYPARNLYVDPLTSVATWDEPVYVAVEMQGFEEEPFPPAGWLNLSNSDGWERVPDGFSPPAWTIPGLPDEGGEWFAVAEDDSDLGDDCCTYLATPELDLRLGDDYQLSFLYFWDGFWGSAGGFVEYTTDGGATWELLEQLSAVSDWTEVTIDLADYSNESSIWFAFHYDDNGFWADGFAVDNVYVGNGPVEVQGYHVFLNDGFEAQTDPETRTYQFNNLQYGQTYTAAVAALYGCNLSEKVFYTFTSNYLYPPRNLMDAYVYNTNEVPLMWNPPVTVGSLPLAPATQADFVEGTYEADFGAIPLNGVAVADLNQPNEELLAGLRAPEVFGVSNDLNSFAFFDAEAPGTVNVIGPWPGGGFANASEIDFEDPNFMYEIDNTGGARRVDLTDGTVTELGNVGIADALGMALDYTTNTYYLATSAEQLYTIDMSDLSTQLVGSFGYSGGFMIGITFNDQGELFGYDLVTDQGWSIDPTTGQATALGPLGMDANFGAGMAYDQLNDLLVLSPFNNAVFACEYRSMDPSSGATTFLGNIGSPGVTQFGTIAIPVVSGPPGGGGDIPPGLVSYNIYQDMMLVDNVPHPEDATPDDTITGVLNPVMPGCYEYTVTAVYDLSVFGFPGQTAESDFEGPDTVCVVYGFDLPFMEAWDEGNFGFNEWITDPQQNNWVIASQFGNPEPSAQFNWDPDPGADYMVSLTSAPLNADMLTEGSIFVEFHYFLQNRNATGDEMLALEIYNGSEWNQVFTVANTGSFDWTPVKVDITDFAMSRVFQIRFTAMGQNSFDVINWNVDNIMVYRECEAPSDLDGEYFWNMEDEFGAVIEWEAPDVPLPAQGYIFWYDGVLSSGIGLTDGGDWLVAARWDAGQLIDFQGTSLTKIGMIPNDDGFTGIVMKVWKGADAGTLLWESAEVQPTPGVWNEYDIDPPVPLDVDDELWIGYEILGQPAGTFPAGTDAGPAVAGYGDKITTNGVTWDNLSDFGLDYNWMLQAYVETLDGAVAPITPLVEDRVYNNPSSDLSSVETTFTGVGSNHNLSTREFTGFNVYRQGPDEMDYELIDFVPYEEGVLEYEYIDEDPFGGEADYPYEVCYQVTSVWESETDFCESVPAASVVPIFDFVCIMVTSIDNPLADGATAMYPNPATDRVNITSSQAMERITVVNYVGQVVYDAQLNNDRQLTLNTSVFEAGVYVVRLTTENGMITKRLVISE